MGLSQIPFTAIVEYGKLYEVEDMEDFLYIIRLMDDEYMRLSNDGNNKKR